MRSRPSRPRFRRRTPWRRLLRKVGGPTTAQEAGLEARDLADGLAYAYYLRDRLPVLRLRRMLGYGKEAIGCQVWLHPIMLSAQAALVRKPISPSGSRRSTSRATQQEPNDLPRQ